MKRLVIVVTIAALVVGIVGCVGGDGSNGGDSYTLVVDFTAGGTVTVNDLPIPGKAILTYDAGTVVGLSASPSAGYRFVEWTGNVSTIDDVNAASTTITMNGDYSITADFKQDVVVTFVDAQLEAVIREAISKTAGDIHSSDLDGLTKLNAVQCDIADLSGLEHCTSLRTVQLHNNQISDVSPLANLTNLFWLGLGPNQVSDISPLANLTYLTYLGLESNQISDISPLANLTNLIWLELQDNQISDISALLNFTDLTKLYLYRNPLSEESINIYIPQLEARGVTVIY